MSNLKSKALANRYVADLIASAPPNEVDFQSAELSAMDQVAVFRTLHQVRERLLADAEKVENQPLTHRHQSGVYLAPARQHSQFIALFKRIN